jgi:DNA-binding FrmR family transcriptional regulator
VHSGVARRDKVDLQQRLNRIEGQVRGIRRMIDEDRYCPEVLTQIAAVRAALDRVGLILLEDHTRGCIVDSVLAGHPDEAMTELMGVLRKFLP